MKAEYLKIFKLFEELEEAGESATLTISSKGGISSIKLPLESSPSSPSTGTTPTTLPPVPGKRRRHRGAAARARRRQRAADHQASLLAAASSASPPASGEASAPAGSPHDRPHQHRPLLFLPTPSPTSGRRRVNGSCLWGGRLCHLLAASTWMAHPLHHHPCPHPLLLQPYLPLLHLQ